MLVTLMGSIAGNEIPPMRNTNKKRFCRASTKADAKFKNIALNNITTLNTFIYYGGSITLGLLGVKNR